VSLSYPIFSFLSLYKISERFFQTFLVQNWKKFGKHIPKFFPRNFFSKDAFQNIYTRAKKKIGGYKRNMGWEEKYLKKNGDIKIGFGPFLSLTTKKQCFTYWSSD
jgi:hypothetical protein